MKVLGIDPGTAACGYGVVERHGTRLRFVADGTWRTTPRTPAAERLKVIFDGIGELVLEHQPDAVAVEESVVGADPRIALFVGQARGVALVAAAHAGVTCTEYSPTRVKQTVCGYGRADKEQVGRMVQMILKLEGAPGSTHAADALAVAICHALASPLVELGAR